MDKKIREKIALSARGGSTSSGKRYQLISPFLAEPARAQNEYFRKQAEIKHKFPRYGLRKVRVSAMKAWLKKYRKGGFDSLKPKNRSDGGRPKRLREDLLKSIEIKCKAYPSLSVQKLYEELRDQNLLGQSPVHYNTLLQIGQRAGMAPSQGSDRCTQGLRSE